MFVRCKSCEKVYTGSMIDMLEEGWGIITETTKEGYETIPELLDKGIEAFNKINTNEATKNIMLRNDILEKLTKLCTDLYYYHLKTRSGIDLAISRALKEKKKFNERKFAKW